MKAVLNYLKSQYHIILIALGGFVLIFLLLWFRLGSLTSGLAADIEIAAQQTAFSWHAILANPLGAPYSVPQHIVTLLGFSNLTAARFISTLWGLVAAFLFYIVARQWHSTRVAYLATWLLVSSSWFLHTARLATPEVLWLVGPLALIVLFSPRTLVQRTWLAGPLATCAVATLLYIPGMVWLVIVSLVLQRKSVRGVWRASRFWWIRLASLGVGLLLAAPLIYKLSNSIEVFKHWLGFNLSVSQPMTILEQLVAVPRNLFVYGNFDPVHWLGHMPLLSSFEALMALLGIAFYLRHSTTNRTQLVVALSAVSWLLIGVGNYVSISLIVPIAYLMVASGVAYLLRQWLRVFPANPLARSIGIGIVAIVIALTSLYQTRSYFVAWRYSTDTTQAFSRHY